MNEKLNLSLLEAKQKENSFKELSSFTRVVQISIQFLRIGEIDTINERYYAEISIESKWIDVGDANNYDPKTRWNPKLYIENILLEPKEVINYEVKKFYDMIRVKETRVVKGFFWEKLELENFPVDTQELSIVVTSKLKSNELELIQDSEKMSFIDSKAFKIFVDQQKWNLYKFVKVSLSASYDNFPNTSTLDNQKAYSTYQAINANLKETNKIEALNSHPKFVVTCYVARRPGYYFYNAYFLIFLITILGLTTFSIDTKYPQSRLQTTFTLVLTSASFKWVINRSLPTISYMTSLDKYSIICIFYLCVICCWHSISQICSIKIDQIMMFTFTLIFAFIHIFFSVWLFSAYQSIRRLEKLNEQFLKELLNKNT